MKAVGILRGEPLVASLVGYICSFFFSFLQNKCCFNDAVWISIIGMIFYSAYLGLYFMYAHNADQRETTVYCILFSVFCILFVMVPGLVANCTTVIQFMYVLAGVVSACTPLGLALFVLENTVENLPDWLSSAFGLLHYLVWGLLASYPNQDYFDITQNAAGVLCSGSLLVMLFIRQRNEAELAAGNGVGVDEAELAAGNGVGVYAPLMANQHGQV